MAETKQLEVFSDFMCPWCYFSTVITDRIQKDYRIPIRWRGFPFHTSIPANGIHLKDLFGRSQADIENMMNSIRAQAKEWNVPFTGTLTLYNSRMVQELKVWAHEQGMVNEFNRAAYQTYFVHSKDLSNISVLGDLAKQVGLDPEEAKTILTSRKFKDQIDTDWARARSLGIRGVPSFVIDNDVFVGAQPYSQFQAFLAKHGVEKVG